MQITSARRWLAGCWKGDSCSLIWPGCFSISSSICSASFSALFSPATFSRLFPVLVFAINRLIFFSETLVHKWKTAEGKEMFLLKDQFSLRRQNENTFCFKNCYLRKPNIYIFNTVGLHLARNFSIAGRNKKTLPLLIISVVNKIKKTRILTTGTTFCSIGF